MPPARHGNTEKPHRFVHPTEIRAHFNGMQLYAKAARGELDQVLRAEYLTPPAANQVPGTVSQLVADYERLHDDQKRPVAIVFQYLQPNGRLGASGRPDPKWLRLPDGTIIAAKSR